MRQRTKDLFSSSPTQCHPDYKCLLSSRMQNVRQHLNQVWQWYLECGLPDDHFLSEFPLQTSKRLWEMETAWFLHNCGFTLSSRKAGADFLCESEGKAFEVEAVAVGPGADDHPDLVREFTMANDGPVRCSKRINIPERERIELLRVAGAIDSKAKKRLCDIDKGVSDSSLPFLIALSVVDIPMMVSDWDMPAALKAVYPIGGQCYDIDPATGRFLRRRWQCRPQIQKGTEAKSNISTQIFCPGCGASHHREISALLYSNLNFREFGYPYNPWEHCRQFFLIHNADCTRELVHGSLNVKAEYWLEETSPNEYVLSKSTGRGAHHLSDRPEGDSCPDVGEGPN